MEGLVWFGLVFFKNVKMEFEDILCMYYVIWYQCVCFCMREREREREREGMGDVEDGLV